MATENWTSPKDIKARIKELEKKYGMKLGNNQGREWDQYRSKNLRPHDSGVGGVDKLSGGRYKNRGDKGWLKIQSEVHAAGQEVASLRQSLKAIKTNDKNLRAAQFRLRQEELATPRKDDPSTPQNEANFGSLLNKGRALLSRKTAGGKNRFLMQRENYLNQKRAEIERLKIGTSGDTEIADYAATKASAKEWNTPFTNQYGVTTTHSDQHKLKIQNQQGGGEDPTLGGRVNSGEILMSGGTVVRQGTVPSNASNLSITKGADGSTQVVETPPSVVPAEGTTEKTTPKTPSYSTDVFTIDPATGEAVGVLTRNQRKNFEARKDVQTSLAAWHADPKNKLRIYKNKGGMMGKYEYSAGG